LPEMCARTRWSLAGVSFGRLLSRTAVCDVYDSS